MRVSEILNEMTVQQAREIFTKLGGDPDNPLVSRKRLILQYHPDKAVGAGHSPEQAKRNEEILKLINAAFDILSGKSRPEQARGPAPGGRQGGASRGSGRGGYEGHTETPPWAWAGHAGGMPPSSNIYRNDYTDVNFIKKRMWELSGKSKQEWTIWGYDGHYFRGVTTVFGSPEIFPEMARAMFDWQTKGGNPYKCRAVFVQKRKSHPIYLVYCDDAIFNPPITFEHASMNSNPGNDQQFMRKLPEILDAVMAAHDAGQDPQQAVPV